MLNVGCEVSSQDFDLGHDGSNRDVGRDLGRTASTSTNSSVSSSLSMRACALLRFTSGIGLATANASRRRAMASVNSARPGSLTPGKARPTAPSRESTPPFETFLTEARRWVKPTRAPCSAFCPLLAGPIDDDSGCFGQPPADLLVGKDLLRDGQCTGHQSDFRLLGSHIGPPAVRDTTPSFRSYSRSRLFNRAVRSVSPTAYATSSKAQSRAVARNSIRT